MINLRILHGFIRVLCAGCLCAVIVMPFCADAADISISHDMCQRLSDYHPAPNVDFVPGQGTGGRMVQPADLDNQGQQMARDIANAPIIIPVTVDLADKLGISQGMLDMDGNIGVLQYRSGQFYFNDRQISGMDPTALRAICQKKPE